MSEAVVDDIVAVLPPLLQSLESLGFIARHLNPPDFDRVMEAAGAPAHGLRAVQNGNGDLVSVLRALRYSPRAQEALYPLAARLPPVSSFFVDPPLREDADLLARLAEPGKENNGIMHND